MIEVVQYGQREHAAEWREFLASSNNGTLFHDLDFLAYHHPNRFNTHHLIFRQREKVIALLPAAIIVESDGKRLLKSPYGASVGGFVLSIGQSAQVTLDLTESLKRYACSLGLDGIEMRIGPTIYMREPNDQLSFALTARGFQLACRWLTMAIPLIDDPDYIDNSLSKRRASYIRAAQRKGLIVRDVGREYLDDFYALLCQDRAKHAAVPTHSLVELEALFEKVPASIRLFLCFFKSSIAAAALVFELNNLVAYNFYPCRDNAYDAFRPALLLEVHVAKHYSLRQFRYLDLGPATFDDLALNNGVASFKEGLGAKGFCRDTWRWER